MQSRAGYPPRVSGKPLSIHPACLCCLNLAQVTAGQGTIASEETAPSRTDESREHGIWACHGRACKQASRRPNSADQASYNLSEHELFNRRQQPHPRGDDREQVTQARREAEALFAPKRPISEPSAPDPSAPADPSPRKPRILRALPTAPVRQEESETPARPAPRMPSGIPRSHFARIRTLCSTG